MKTLNNIITFLLFMYVGVIMSATAIIFISGATILLRMAVGL